MKRFTTATLALGAALAACFVWFYETYVHWRPTVFPVAAGALVTWFALFSFFFVWTRMAAPRRAAPLVFKSLILVAVFAAILFGVSYVLNNAMYDGRAPALAANAAVPIAVLQCAVMFGLLLRGVKKEFGKSRVIWCGAAIAVMFIAAGVFGIGLPIYVRIPDVRDFAYAAQSDAQKMDIYLPAKKGAADVLLYIHGGGWQEGNKTDQSERCRAYAKQGYAAATMNYRMITPGLPLEEQTVTCADMLDDIGAAIAALKDKLTELGYAPRKLAIFGNSAGGHLTMLYGYSRHAGSAIPIAFLAPDVGPSDFSDPEQLVTFGGEAALWLYSAMAGQTVTESDVTGNSPLIQRISPITYVDANVPPTLLRYGGMDTLVPMSQATRIKAALDGAGVRNDLIIYPNSGHELNGDDDAAEAAFSAKFDEYCEAYF